MTEVIWLARANAALVRLVGLELDDVPRYDWRAAYQSGVSFRDAAVAATRVLQTELTVEEIDK